MIRFLKSQYSISYSFCFVKKGFFIFFVNIRMSYYWFNRQELLKKAKEKYDNGG